VFPLQLLGFEVDYINSVHFSNHTGYPVVKGDVLRGEQLRDVLDGLVQNDLLENTGHLLTGYIGSESFLEAVLDVLKTLRGGDQTKRRIKNIDDDDDNNNDNDDAGDESKQSSSNNRVVRFVCDPVLGDAGRFYVPESLVKVYREQVVPLADVLTPNQFEVEQLTGIQVESYESALAACDKLHDMGPSLVFITSFVLPPISKTRKSVEGGMAAEGGGIDGGSSNNTSENMMAIIASARSRGEPQQQRQAQQQHLRQQEVWCVEFPEIACNFTGTGDLCTALLLAHTADLSSLASSSVAPANGLSEALEKVINTMYAVLERTQSFAENEKGKGDDDKYSARARELKLIQSKSDIENPPQRFKAKRIR